MIRLRIALGVASSLVAVAALTIVFAGSGEAQGNGNGQPIGPSPQNVQVVNTPLPVTGNLNAVVSGNVSASIINPSNNPVLIRDVDAQGGKELWQHTGFDLIPDGTSVALVEFPVVPPGRVLIIEHINFLYTGPEPLFALHGSSRFDGSVGGTDFQVFVPHPIAGRFVADAQTKFYVPPGENLRAISQRIDTTGNAQLQALATGYLVNFP